MFEASGKVATQFMHGLSGEGLHESTERKLILLAPPILNPAQVGVSSAVIAERHLRNQGRVVAKRRKDHLIDGVIPGCNSLAEISNPENSIEGFGIRSEEHTS